MAAPFTARIIAIGDYDQSVAQPFPRLLDPGSSVREEADRIRSLLETLDAEVVIDTVTPEELKSADWVAQQLREWSDYAAGTSSMLVWVGHGISNGTHAWLASYRSDALDQGSGHQPSQFGSSIDRDWSRRKDHVDAWAFVVVEACGAERFVDLVNADLVTRVDAPKRMGLVSAGGEGTAFLGTFSRVLETVLASYTDNDDTISVHDLAAKLQEYLGGTGGVIQRFLSGAPIPRPKVLAQGITATQDVADELQRFIRHLPEDQRSHYLPKAQGAEQGEAAWFFTGRNEERARIVEWLRTHDRGMLIVTGPAGSGKSALLGNLVAHADPQLRRLLIAAGRVESLPEAEQPADAEFDLAVTLTGRSLDDAIQRIAVAVGAELGDAAEPAERVAAIVAALDGRTFTIVADALDESIQPLDIARTVLRPLAEAVGTRVIVGTRTSTHEQLDGPVPDDEDLLDALGGGLETPLVVVSEDPDAIRRYVSNRLNAAHADGRLEVGVGAADELFERVAARIASESPRFIYSRLMVHEIIADPELLSDDAALALEDLFDGSHRAAFRYAVHRLERTLPLSRAVLKSLAFAEGRGLPRVDGIWAAVASALHGDTVTDADLAATLTAAAPYIMLDGESGQSVYRLAHQTFRETFLAERDTDRDEGAVFKALLDVAANASVLNPYLALYLPRHAERTGGWEALAEHVAVVDGLDVGSLAAALFRARVARPPLPILGTITSRPDIERSPTSLRPSLRVLGEARIAEHSINGALVDLPLQVEWAVRHATETPVVPMTGHTGSVVGLASVVVAGEDRLVSIGLDRTVRFWDPVSGGETHPALDLPISGGSRVVTLHRDDKDFVAVSADEGLYIIDPASGAIHQSCAHGALVDDFEVVDLAEGGPVLLARRGTTLALCTPWGEHQPREVASEAEAHSVLRRRDGSTVCAVYQGSGTSIVSLDGELRELSTLRGDYIRHVRLIESSTGRLLLAESLEDLLGVGGPLVEFRDVLTGELLGALKAGKEPLSATERTAVLRAFDQTLLVTSDDENIGLWDPESLARVRSFSKRVHHSLRVTPGDTVDFLVLTHRDGVSVVDPESGDTVNELVIASSEVTDVIARAAPAGLAVAAADGGIRIWDPLGRKVATTDARFRVPVGNGLVLHPGVVDVLADKDGHRWAAATGARLARVRGADQQFESARWHGKSIAVEYGWRRGGVTLIDPQSGRAFDTILRTKGIFGVKDPGKGDSIVVARNRNRLSVWSLEGTRLGPLIPNRGVHLDSQVAVVWRAGRLTVVLAGIDQLEFWDVATGALTDTIPADPRWGRAALAAIAQPDGRAFIWYEGANATHVIDVESATDTTDTTPARPIRLPEPLMDPRGRVVFVESGPGGVLVWAPAGNERRHFESNAFSSLVTATFVNAGECNVLVAGHLDGEVQAWDYDTGRVLGSLPLGFRVVSLIPVAGGVIASTAGGIVRLRIQP